MSPPKCLLFSRTLTALTEVLGRDICANDPRMSAGYPSQKLPLWADFSFLKTINHHRPRAKSSSGPQVYGRYPNPRNTQEFISYFPRSPENFCVDCFFKFAWEFCIEKWQGFLVNFFWSPFPTKTPQKIRSKIRGKIRDDIGNIRGTSVLQLY